jgi:hypothetical protein
VPCPRRPPRLATRLNEPSPIQPSSSSPSSPSSRIAPGWRSATPSGPAAIAGQGEALVEGEVADIARGPRVA